MFLRPSTTHSLKVAKCLSQTENSYFLKATKCFLRPSTTHSLKVAKCLSQTKNSLKATKPFVAQRVPNKLFLRERPNTNSEN